MARQAVGVLDSGYAALASARRSYAQDLEDQIRAKKVGRPSLKPEANCSCGVVHAQVFQIRFRKSKTVFWCAIQGGDIGSCGGGKGEWGSARVLGSAH